MTLALRALARREHSSQELASKLRQRGCEESDISATLAELARRGWQSDDRYARMAVTYGARRGLGPRRLRMQLQHAGIAVQTSLEGLADSEIDWFEEALRTANKYVRTKSLTDISTRQKLQAHLLRRGYTADQIRSVLKRLNESCPASSENY